MAEFLDDFAAIEPYLDQKGEHVLLARGGISISGGLIGRVSLLDIWEPTPGLLRFTLPLPFRFFDEGRDAAVAALARINSQLIGPGFLLRQSPPKWGILFAAYAYMNHDGTISSRVVDAVIEMCRSTVDRYVAEIEQIVREAESASHEPRREEG